VYFVRQLYATALLYGGPFIFAIVLMFAGPAAPSWWGASALIAAFLTAYGYNIGSHYAFTHRTFVFPRWVELALIYISTLSACASPLSWAVHHNAHHRHVETAADPHSPSQLGWRALFLTSYATDKANLMSVRHLIKDPAQRFADRNVGFWSITLSWPFVAAAVFGLNGLVYLWLLPLWYVLAVAVAFVFCHTGKFDVRSKSRAVNSVLLGLLSLGDGDHLEHHRNMRSCGKKTKFFARLAGGRSTRR